MVGHERSCSIKAGDQACALLEYTHKHCTYVRRLSAMTGE